MTNMEGVSNLLHVCSRKTEEFLWVLENKHMLWLLEIGEEARKMFSTDFNAEPELMPKTPSQKRRRKKRTSVVPDENHDPNVRRSSRRRSSSSWSTSVRRLSTRIQKPVDASIQEEPEKPKRMTRAQAQTSILCPSVPEKPLPESPKVSQDLQVKITAEERRSADLQLADAIPNTEEKTEEPIPEISISSLPVTPDAKCHSIAKLSLTKASTPKQDEDVTQAAKPQPIELDAEQPLDPKDRTTPTGSRSDRRSVRRSLVGWQSTSHRASLVTQYSLASKRESMTREAVRKSMRRSISKKRAMENSSSSSRSYQSSVDEDTIKVRPEPEISLESPVPQSGRLSLRSRTCKKIAISNQPEEPQRDTQPANDTDVAREFDDPQMKRRKSYKRAVDELSDDEQREGEELSPPRKKTPSPPCPPSKVVKPPPHMKSFLHTVQKNQLLMMTPGSIGKNIMVKSFIKRNTPLKTDPKEKERLKQEALRKKEETELLRKQKVQEEKKRKQEELKLRREERLRKVLQARERVEQIEEEKKKKIEQKFAQIDEKSEKVKEDRIAEEKAKKKITAKKQEEVESRRKQEEETRRLKAKQMEEDERKYQEQIQKKREEEEQERQKKILEAKRLAEQKQAEQERERQREQQQAAEREQERQRAEKERVEKERLLQLQRELERAAQLKEQLRKEEEQERLEKLHKEQEAKRLQEEQERKAKEQAEASTAPALNVTVDIRNSPACESYQMTPQSYKVPVPKIDPENYGMDLNSDDSTDDESQPRKPIPPWASGNLLGQAIRKQYYNPIDVDRLFGTIESPKLEDMFYKSKPRYFKRTSSAVWHSPPLSSNRHHLAVGYGLKKY
ncbi:inner centromere protein isoform X2 [Bombina bombina]|uniref:inner centromere protein isoform X2 n=1 Tax=Bombina bombina TaxID=8345 RepID=UPI00235A6EE7|nr:inner centromere protein isoform X2 [Bombina bombina]